VHRAPAFGRIEAKASIDELTGRFKMIAKTDRRTPQRRTNLRRHRHPDATLSRPLNQFDKQPGAGDPKRIANNYSVLPSIRVIVSTQSV